MSAAQRDQSSMIAAMVMARIGMEGRPRKSMSGCALLDLSMASPPELQGSVLVYRPVSALAANLEVLMASSFSVASARRSPRSRATKALPPAVEMEEKLAAATDAAGAWVDEDRLPFVSLVYRTGAGAIAVYGRPDVGLLSQDVLPVVMLPFPAPEGRAIAFLDSLLPRE